MATYIITSPDGEEFEITAPDDASEEEIMSYAQSQFAQPKEPPAPSSPPPAAPQEEVNYGDRENMMSTRPRIQERLAEDLLTGIGRFLSEAGQGIKQKGLMAGEALGLVDEGEAEAYTQETINPDRRRWEQGTEGVGAEDVGYYGAMLAPAAALPATGVLATAGIAGLEAGMMPTSEAEWEQAFEQAAIGAGFAGGLRAVPELAAAFKQWRKNVQLGKVDQDVAALAEQTGVKVPRSVNRPSSIGKVAEEAMDTPIFGRAGATAMRRDAADTLDQMERATRTGENVDDAYKYGKEVMEEADSAAWTKTYDAIGDSPIDRQHINNMMDDVMADLSGDTIGQAKKASIQNLWRPMHQRPDFKVKRGTTKKDYDEFNAKWDALEEVRGFKGDTLADLHRFRAKFGAAQQADWAKEGWDTKHLKNIYGAITDELYNAASRSYGKKGERLLNKSIEGTKQMIRTQDNARVMKSAANDKIDSNSTFVRAALSGDHDRMQAMKTILGKEGMPTVQNEIIRDIAEQFRIGQGRAAATRVRKLDPAIRQFFGEDQAAAIRGLGKFMDNIPKERQETMRSVLSGLIYGGGLAGSVPATGAITATLFQWTKRQDVNAMLQKLNTAAKDSPLYKALSDELTESLMVVAGVEASRPPMEVEIRNGVPQ